MEPNREQGASSPHNNLNIALLIVITYLIVLQLMSLAPPGGKGNISCLCYETQLVKVIVGNHGLLELMRQVETKWAQQKLKITTFHHKLNITN